MTTTRPVFVLGVGAQKAGTSFLYQALNSHPDVEMSTPKEMRAFNSHFLPDECTVLADRLRNRIPPLLERNPLDLNDQQREFFNVLIRTMAIHYDLREYPRYFHTLLRETGARVTGDITPAYQLLSADHFKTIRELLEKDFDLKVIFLMRDPIDRLYSAFRMRDRYNAKIRPGREINVPAPQRFIRNYRTSASEGRTRYELAIQALEEAFDPAQLHYAFYEELFRPETFEAISRFVGVDGLAPDFDEKVNASPDQGGLSAEDIATAREYYDATYAFCLQRFGEERIRKIWRYA